MKSISLRHNLPVAMPLLVALLLTAGGCSGDDAPTTARQMEFAAGTAAETRASDTEPLDGTQYTVWAAALYVCPDVTAEYYFGSDRFRQLDYRSATGTFAATDYYYPFSGTMHLVAYATTPYAAGYGPTVAVHPDVLTGSVSGLTTMEASVGGTRAGTYEILYSDPLAVDCGAVVPEPTMRFRRQQANLRFRFTADQATCDHIIINYIRVENVATSLDFTLNCQTGTLSPVWGAEADRLVLNLTGNHIDFASGLDAGNGIYIRPRATRSRIVINYTMLNADTLDGHIGSSNNRTINYVVNDDYSLPWQLGYRYNYNIKVRANYQMDIRDIKVQLVSDGHTGTMNI